MSSPCFEKRVSRCRQDGFCIVFIVAVVVIYDLGGSMGQSCSSSNWRLASIYSDVDSRCSGEAAVPWLWCQRHISSLPTPTSYVICDRCQKYSVLNFACDRCMSCDKCVLHGVLWLATIMIMRPSACVQQILHNKYMSLGISSPI